MQKKRSNPMTPVPKLSRSQRRKRKHVAGAKLVDRKTAREEGIILPVSRQGTCVADTTTILFSAILDDEDSNGIQTKNGFVPTSQLKDYVRNALSPDGNWTQLEDMVSFVRLPNNCATMIPVACVHCMLICPANMFHGTIKVRAAKAGKAMLA